jgi:type II restriction enzyme
VPYRVHLDQADRLVTTSDQARGALIAFLVEKAESAIPLIEQAKALRVAALACSSATELLHRREIWTAVLMAAGLSIGEIKQLPDEYKVAVIQSLINEYLQPRGAQFVDELVYRFLVARGMGLAKALRKLVILVANRNIARGIVAALLVRDIPMMVKRTANSVWQSWNASTDDPPLGVRGIAWASSDGPRTLLFNTRVPSIGRSVSVVVRRFSSMEEERATLHNPAAYLAVGQVSSGFDPEGKDDHWHGAERALEQIIDRFTALDHVPQTFFVGGIIDHVAALEIWDWLRDGRLDNAANSNDEVQLGSLCQWLISL